MSSQTQADHWSVKAIRHGRHGLPACLLWKLVLEEMLYVNYKSSIILVHKSQSLSGSSADSLACSII